MRFTLVDRIVALEPGKTITAVKNLSLAEEYLADHFPGFPVLPGVLMLEAMTQAAAWLVHPESRQAMPGSAQLPSARLRILGVIVSANNQIFKKGAWEETAGAAEVS